MKIFILVQFISNQSSFESKTCLRRCVKMDDLCPKNNALLCYREEGSLTRIIKVILKEEVRMK